MQKAIKTKASPNNGALLYAKGKKTTLEKKKAYHTLPANTYLI